ncbi:hypothetical protein SASPL_141000 [Salvia splendens]|uniref:C2 domain-containing protein n=1 Tax=Salvia splendens TaxID=180675 RepID=A0A8X8WSV4_SALSN|nr:hypothetical protein SASPL_141000 [Salvia splendens]
MIVWDGRGTTDAYCVAKYGHKWVRTRTVVESFSPKWNKQYTWEVYDPCTVVTLGVLDNCHLAGGNGRDSRIGTVRIQLSTLETDKIYTHSYPLLVLQPSGLKKMGELHLAFRLARPILPNRLLLLGPSRHEQVDNASLPVEESDHHHSSSVLSTLHTWTQKCPGQRGCIRMSLMRNLTRSRHLDHRVRSVAGRIQTVAGDMATQGERILALLSWRDPRATTIFLLFCLSAAVVLFVTPFKIVTLLVGLFLLRHPRFRSKMHSAPSSFFRRLPARADSIL